MEAGIFAEQVEYDADGNVVGPLAQPDPSAPLISLDIHEIDTDGDGVADVFFPNGRHDWAPDGSAVTWHEQADDGNLDWRVGFHPAFRHTGKHTRNRRGESELSWHSHGQSRR